MLDVSYPGGTDAFLEIASATDGVRYAIADRQLTVVSVLEPAPLHVQHERLFDLRIVAADEDGAPEMVPPARRASRPAADERLSLCVSGQRDLTLAFC